MTTTKGTYTIPEAAELWIATIQAPETKATPEQKESLIAQIRSAAPKARAAGIGYPYGFVPAGVPVLFVDACNAIKKIIRDGK